eukprot:Gb_13571 [translate_table: standard]
MDKTICMRPHYAPSPEDTKISSMPAYSEKASTSSVLPVTQQMNFTICSESLPLEKTNLMGPQPPASQSGPQVLNKPSSIQVDTTIANKPQLEQISSSEENLRSYSFQNSKVSPVNPQLEKQSTLMSQSSEDRSRLPQTRTEYNGHPMVMASILVNFGSLIETSDISLHATCTHIYIEAKSFQPLEIPLVFPTLPSDVHATIDSCEGLLQVNVPFFSYTKLFNKAD